MQARRERMRIMGIAVALLLAGWSGAAVGQETQAAPIPPDAAVKQDQVHGLKAEYYNFGKVRPPGVAGIDSRDIAADFVAGRSPDATWMLDVRSIDFPPGPQGTMPAGGKTIGEFLLGAGDNTNAPLTMAMSTRNIYVFTGFIEVPAAGTFTFRIPSDDGAELTIGGVVVHSHMHGGFYAPTMDGYAAKAEFVEPGIYPVKVLFWDRDRDAGIEVYSDVNPAGERREVAGARELTLLPFLTGPAAKP